ncbi:MAG: hypothetical protein DWQ36_11840 [Acidobacteria bacterium]|nr:MAG: hypothetical protein DWQ30_02725 [Acidobacteriota bacterium]REK07413.1 MAG: hypothetical protein DWQ36_11840 [Acidobacteriota bacterium]
MSAGLELTSIPSHQRTASTLDVALLFAGANVVSSTLITGATLGAATTLDRALAALLLGLVVGTLPLAVLARTGPRYGLPSMVLLRGPFGRLGAATVSALLVVTNFAWIGLNNQVAAGAFAALVDGDGSGVASSDRPGPEGALGGLAPILADPTVGSVVVGAAAIAVALFGPAAMARFDRVAVPLMVLLGVALTVALVRGLGDGAPLVQQSPGPARPLGVLAGLDLVIGYQVSWSLMFADYTRYQRSEAAASRAVFFGLTLTSGWLMTLGLIAARTVGSNDPAQLVLASGLPAAALLVLALATVTTNFVNLYLSGLAIRTLVPAAPQRATIVVVGLVGTALSAADQRLLDRYAAFMGLLATLLLPIVAIALVHFFWLRRGDRDAGSATSSTTAVSFLPAWIAWAAGAATYQAIARLAPAVGATGATLVVAALVYLGASPLAGAGRGPVREA